MPGYLSIVLHAHLPFVRHPEHEKFLEEAWLFEAITETYLPLLQVINGWAHDGLHARLTFTLSPTLCTMLRDPLLQARFSTLGFIPPELSPQATRTFVLEDRAKLAAIVQARNIKPE